MFRFIRISPILRIIDLYKDYPCMKLIKSKSNSRFFNFTGINIKEIKNSYQNFDPKKTFSKDNIKTNLLMKNADFFAKYTCDDINASIHLSKFVSNLKHADIVPTHKNNSKVPKENYRPISFSVNISKIYKRCVYAIQQQDISKKIF